MSPHEVWVTFVTGLPRTGVGVAPEQPQEEPQQPPTVVLTRLGGDTVQIVTACARDSHSICIDAPALLSHAPQSSKGDQHLHMADRNCMSTASLSCLI